MRQVSPPKSPAQKDRHAARTGTVTDGPTPRRQTRSTNEVPMNDELMIEAHGLTKRYGHVTALAGIDLEVPAGSILGVLGPNGAGKTTAIRILTTLALPEIG